MKMQKIVVVLVSSQWLYINQLENAMRGACTWHQWRDNLIRLYENPTETLLHELFNNWVN